MNSKMLTLKRIWRRKYMYLMLLPAIVYYIIFHYAPMYGATIAFRDFNIIRGIMGSEWIGLANFEQLLGMSHFRRAFWNTLTISLQRLFWGFPVPIIFAILLNEIKSMRYKKFVQTSVYIPHFISWVIVGGLLVNMLSITDGIVNQAIVALGFAPIGFLSDERFFIPTMIVSMIWKSFGWTAIIYMAALSGVDPELYDAAKVDGVNRWQKTRYITLPCIQSTIVVMFILRLGSLMEAGFEQIFVLYHPGVFRVADILDTFVFRLGLHDGRFAMASAVGLFRSAINFSLLVAANMMARRVGEQGVY